MFRNIIIWDTVDRDRWDYVASQGAAFRCIRWLAHCRKSWGFWHDLEVVTRAARNLHLFCRFELRISIIGDGGMC